MAVAILWPYAHKSSLFNVLTFLLIRKSINISDFFPRFVVPLVAYVTRDWKTQFQILSSLAIFAPLLMNYVPGKLPSLYFSIQITPVVQKMLCIKNLWEGMAIVIAVNDRRCIFTFGRSRRPNTWKDSASYQIPKPKVQIFDKNM